MENAGLGIGQAPNGMQVQRNPLSPFKVTEYVTEVSADGRPLAGGVKIGEIGLFEVFRELATSGGDCDCARFSTKDRKIQFIECDVDRNKILDKSTIVLNTGKRPYKYEDLNLDGILDVMSEGLNKEEEFYVLINDTWTPATRCTDHGAIMRGNLFVFSEATWHLSIDVCKEAFAKSASACIDGGMRWWGKVGLPRNNGGIGV